MNFHRNVKYIPTAVINGDLKVRGVGHCPAAAVDRLVLRTLGVDFYVVWDPAAEEGICRCGGDLDSFSAPVR